MTDTQKPKFAITERLWQVIILILAAVVLVITFWCLTNGITIIFMHLYYFPIVLLAYHYRWKGCALATVLALAYLGLVVLFESGQPDVVLGAVYRFLIFVGIAAIIAYLSEQLNRAERAGFESTQLKEQYISLAPAIILVLDHNGSITYLNEKGCKILECPTVGIAGRDWVNTFIKEDEREYVRSLFIGIMSGDPVPDRMVEGAVVTGNGNTRYIRWNITLLKARDGTITGVLSYGEDITEEKAARDSLKTLQQFQENVIANANIWISVLAPNGTILVWNNAAEAISGYKNADVVGKNTIWKQLYPDTHYRKKVTGEIRRIIEQDTILENFETEIRCEDLTTKTIVWNTRGLRDDQGIVTSYIAIGRDVTAQKAAEFRAGESARFLGAMIDTLPVPVFFKDTEGKYLGCNPPFSDYLGISREDIVGKSVYDLSPHELAEKYAAADRQLFENPVPRRYETQVQYADGSRHDVIFYKSPFFNKDGTLGGLIGVFLDITDQKRSETSLRESEKKYRAFFTTSRDCVFITTLDGSWLDFNDAAVKLFGYENREDLLKVKVPHIYANPAERDAHIRYIRENGYSFEYPVDLKKRDGTIINTLITTVARKDATGAVIGFQGSIRDVTERNAILDRMQKLLRLQEEQVRIINTSPVVAFLWKAEENWPVEMVSENISQFGYTRDDLLSGRIQYSAIIHPDDLGHVTAEVEHNSSHGIDDYSQEYRIFGKSGDVYWVADFTHIRRDPSGQITHYEGLVLDITNRKQMEETIRESEQKFREIFDNANDGIEIVALNNDGFPDRFIDVNAVACQMLHYTREELLKMGPLDINTENFSRPFDQIMAELHSIGHATFETEHRTKEELVFPVEVNTHLVSILGKRVILSVVRDITDRKRTEDALRASERRSATLLEAIPDMMFIISRDGVYRDFRVPDPSVLAIPAERIVGTNVRDSGFPEESTRLILRHITRALETKELQLFDYEITFPQGMRQYEARLVALNEGEVLGIVRDITDRKQAEDALRESRQLFADIISFLPDPTFVIDKDGIVVAWNRALEQLSGVPAADIIGKGDHEYSLWVYEKRRPTLIDLVLHPDQDAGRLNYLDIHNDGRTITAQTEIRKPERDRVITLSLVASPLLDSQGNTTGAIESMRDITRLREAEADLARINQNLEQMVRDRTRALEEEVAQRMRAEKEVQAALDYTRSVIEANPDLMAVLDSNGIIRDVNTAGEVLTGIKKEQLIGTTYFGYLVEDGTVQSAFAGLLEKGTIENQVRIQRTDGHITPLSVHATVIPGRDGSSDQVIVAAHDITRQKQDEDAIRASLEEKVLLLREIHHRVKNNLQIIISLTNLQMRQTNDPVVKQIISETQNRVRAMSLVHEKLYRSTSLSRIDFADYTRFLATQLFSYFGTDTRRVKLDFAMEEIMVDINTAVPLGLLMNELVSNALKHAFPGGKEGTIGISGTMEGDRTILVVRDDGIGMPPDLDWTNTASLGMRLVTSLVDQVNGTITLDASSGTAWTIAVQKTPKSDREAGE